MACSTSITGTNSSACAHGTGAACSADPCCSWNAKYEECSPKACSAIDDQSPDVCAGCVTCPGNWTISADRGVLPWDVYVTGEVLFASGGSIAIPTTGTRRINIS